jgi:2-polyprenyl-3-methyl-5-hydroxy-6-metoxy-1,4-benzoquinol methylase
MKPKIGGLARGAAIAIALAALVAAHGSLLYSAWSHAVVSGTVVAGIAVLLVSLHAGLLGRSRVLEGAGGEEMHDHARRFVPAAGADWLLPFYDPIVRLFGREARVRGALLDAAQLDEATRILDLGCGTGSLVMMLKERHPAASVSAIDPDPNALAIARAKAERAHVHVDFERAFADALPYRDGTFDRVLSSLMLHHLTDAEKDSALREVFRVLSPGGTLHVLDFEETRGPGLHALASRLHGAHGGEHALHVPLSDRLRTAGFAQVVELETIRTLFGRVALHRAKRIT